MQVLIEWRKHGLVHGDLKPSNIGVDSDGNLLLFDLEACPTVDKEGSVAHSNGVYTRCYAAPELLSSHEINGGTDLYAMGVMLKDALVRACVVHFTSVVYMMLCDASVGMNA